MDSKLQPQPKKATIPRLITVISVLLGVYSVLYLAGALAALDIAPVGFQHNGIILGTLLLLAFLLYPARKGGPQPYGVTWYDIVALLLGLIPIFYLVVFYGAARERWVLGYASTTEVVFAVMVFLGLLEAIRRTTGLGLAVIALFFLVYPLVGTHMPGVLLCPDFSLDRLAYQIYLTGDGILGMPVGVIASIVVAFILFGEVLSSTGGGKAILDIAYSLVGSVRGGPAKAAVVASGLFGSISGSTIANVSTTGAITIPMMKRMGYKPEFAGAVETVAANGGQILPPVMGAVAFIMAMVTGIPYVQVTFHAYLTAVLYYIVEFVIVDRESVRLNLGSLPKNERPQMRKTLQGAWLYLLPLTLLVVLLVALRYSVGKAGLWSAALLALITLFRKETRLTLRGIVNVFTGTARILVMVTMACAGAGIIIGSMALTAVGSNFSMALLDLSGGNLLVLLLFVAIACFLFGMVGSGIASYLALSVIVAPTMVKMGVPLVAAHLFIVWWAITAYITPPVALGVYAASALAGSDIMKTGWWAVRLGIGTFIIPFMFVYHPALVMLGSPGEIILATIIAFIGMVALACGTAGYLSRKMNWGQRILLIAGAMAIAYSEFVVNVIGFALIAVGVLWHQLATRGGGLASKVSP